MKKKNVKSLKLNKQSIYNHASNTIKTDASTLTLIIITSYADPFGFGCDSANGCTQTPYETLTCADWSCIDETNLVIIDT